MAREEGLSSLCRRPVWLCRQPFVALGALEGVRLRGLFTIDTIDMDLIISIYVNQIDIK
jgi:hypothetical protein